MQVAKAFLIVLTLLLWCWLFGLWITGHIQKAHHQVPVIFWSLHTTWCLPSMRVSVCAPGKSKVYRYGLAVMC